MYLSVSRLEVEQRDVRGAVLLEASSNLSNWTLDESIYGLVNIEKLVLRPLFLSGAIRRRGRPDQLSFDRMP
jgi:hypothetical protein